MTLVHGGFYTANTRGPPGFVRQPLVLSGELSGLSGEPLGLSGEPLGLSGEPLGLSGEALGLSGEPLGLSGEPWVVRRTFREHF